MHTMTSSSHWRPANDNEKAPVEPPSITPATAQTIPNASADNDVALMKDAVPAKTNGFPEMGARSAQPKSMLKFSTWLFVRGADPLIGLPGNDL